MLEYGNLYDHMLEEDPEHRLVRNLQDAGVIPVDQPASIGSRPRGISSSIPQEAIDRMMNEPDQTNAPEEQKTDDIAPKQSKHITEEPE